MQTIKEPKNFEEENWIYLSVGYYNGKAILKDETGTLFYMQCEEAEAPIGTMVSEGQSILPVKDLSEAEGSEITRIYQEE